MTHRGAGGVHSPHATGAAAFLRRPAVATSYKPSRLHHHRIACVARNSNCSTASRLLRADAWHKILWRQQMGLLGLCNRHHRRAVFHAVGHCTRAIYRGISWRIARRQPHQAGTESKFRVADRLSLWHSAQVHRLRIFHLYLHRRTNQINCRFYENPTSQFLHILISHIPQAPTMNGEGLHAYISHKIPWLIGTTDLFGFADFHILYFPSGSYFGCTRIAECYIHHIAYVL